MPVPVDLSKLSDAAKNVIKKTAYLKLFEKVNKIDTSGYVFKTKYNLDKSKLEKTLILVYLFKKNKLQ